MADKPQRGGARPGAGRRPLNRTEERNRAVPFSISLPKWVAEALAERKSDVIKALERLAKRWSK